MAEQPSADDKLILTSHYAEIAKLQKHYGITAKGGICTHYPYGDDHLIVEADGTGGGTLRLVDERYPFDDCMEHYSHDFSDEDEACKAAEWFDTHLEEGGDMSAREFFGKLEAGEKPWEDTD